VDAGDTRSLERNLSEPKLQPWNVGTEIDRAHNLAHEALFLSAGSAGYAAPSPYAAATVRNSSQDDDALRGLNGKTSVGLPPRAAAEIAPPGS